MDILGNQAKTQLEMSRNYHDMGSVNKLREAAQAGDDKALDEAAKQFEAIFVQMMLTSMRKAQDAVADKDSPFSSDQVKFYRDMHDKQLATDLASTGSLGLAEIIVQQMKPGGDFMPASAIRNDANLNTERLQQIQRAQNTVLGTDDTSQKRAGFDSPAEFVSTLYPQAQKIAQEFGLDAKALIAQAALETGWGQHMIHQPQGQNSHNLFGIKANHQWQGEKAVVDTLEFVNQVPEKQRAAFRAYPSFEDSMRDYAQFVQSNPRYQNAVQSKDNPQQYFSELQQAGYATDPNYAKKVMSVYDGELLGALLP